MTERKPAYIIGPKARSVTLQGPALRVRARGAAEGFLPLSRLSRVVVIGDVAWQSRALTACMREGIAVTFAAGNGEALGFCLPAHDQPSGLGDLLLELGQREDWQEQVGNWLAAEQRRVVRRVLRRCGIRQRDLRPAQVWPRVLRYLDNGWHGQTEELLHAWEAPALTQTVVVLREHGLDAGALDEHRLGLDLLEHFLELARWDLAHCIPLNNPAAPRLAPTRRERLADYQAIAPRLEGYWRSRLQRLTAWLRNRALEG